MHWKVKAAIQNTVSLLPSSVSYDAYYWLQRHFGRLKRINPVGKLSAGIETWIRIRKLGHDPLDKVFLEVGTGRVPLVPLAYWLMGARQTITVDLNPYLKSELVKESLDYICENAEEIRKLFGPLLREDRLGALAKLNRSAEFTASAFLDLCRIDYIAPGDASDTRLDPGLIDFHTSCTVFEHISPEVLERIIAEGNRITRDGGLFIHRIDYSDHFSHLDKSISPINFLQFSDDEWERYAGNRYMYMNRLRHDDFVRLFQSAGHRILAADLDVDAQSQELLRNGRLRLDERFLAKSEETLAIRGAWIASQKGI